MLIMLLVDLELNLGGLWGCELGNTLWIGH